jgi:hypothetical protein
MSHFTSKPAPVVGHSKGGALMIQLADAQPFRFSHLINLDGLPSKRPMSRPGRARAHPHDGQRHRRLARPPPHHRHRACASPARWKSWRSDGRR